MSRPKKSYRQRLQLLKQFAKRLAAYSAAAAATVVSLHSTANAEDVFTDITDVNVGRGVKTFTFNIANGALATITSTGWMYANTEPGSFGFGSAFNYIYAQPGQLNDGMLGFQTQTGTVSDLSTWWSLSTLPAGAAVSAGLVNSNRDFGGIGNWQEYGIGNYAWLGGIEDGSIVGLRFTLPDGEGEDQTHYGWAQLSPADSGVILHGFGYNTTPGAPSVSVDTVDVPEPSSLMLLAAGAVGLAGWRRRRSGKAA